MQLANKRRRGREDRTLVNGWVIDKYVDFLNTYPTHSSVYNKERSYRSSSESGQY